MRLFRRWDKERCEAALDALQEGIASGAQSIQYPNGGGMALTTLQNAAVLVDHLERRIDELDGKRRRGSAVRYVPVITSPTRGL
jgi:hypothetical protein